MSKQINDKNHKLDSLKRPLRSNKNIDQHRDVKYDLDIQIIETKNKINKIAEKRKIQEIIDLNDTLFNLIIKEMGVERKKCDYENENDALKEINADLGQKCASMEQKLKDDKSIMDTLIKDNNDQINDFTVKVKNLEKDLDESKNTIKSILDKQENERNDYDQKLENYNHKIKDMTIIIENLSKINKEQAKEIVQKENIILKLQNENHDKDVKMKKISNDMKLVSDENEGLKIGMEGLKRTICDLNNTGNISSINLGTQNLSDSDEDTDLSILYPNPSRFLINKSDYRISFAHELEVTLLQHDETQQLELAEIENYPTPKSIQMSKSQNNIEIENEEEVPKQINKSQKQIQ